MLAVRLLAPVTLQNSNIGLAMDPPSFYAPVGGQAGTISPIIGLSFPLWGEGSRRNKIEFKYWGETNIVNFPVCEGIEKEQ